MTRYIVTITEEWKQDYYIEADSEEEAIKQVVEGADGVETDGREFVRTVERDGSVSTRLAYGSEIAKYAKD